MSDFAAVQATFRTILNRVESTGPSVAKTDSTADFVTALATTILPRTVTVTAGDGTRLSVIARNRRVVRVREVHPADLWTGDMPAHETACEGDFDAFARHFTGALMAVTARDDVRTETKFVDGELPESVLAGYPASRMAGDLEKARDEAAKPRIPPLQALREAWADHACAWSGAEAGVALPEDMPINANWMQKKLAEWTTACDGDGDGPHLRFVTIGGDAPMALAFAALGAEHCIVCCHTPEDFMRLEADLSALRHHSRGG